MKKVFKFVGCQMLVFLTGAVVSNNLSRLIPVNPNYHVSWGNVCFALLLTVVFGVWAYSAASEPDDPWSTYDPQKAVKGAKDGG